MATQLERIRSFLGNPVTVKKILTELETKDEGVANKVLSNLLTVLESVDKSVLDCTPESFLVAIKTANQLGLAIDKRELGYLVKYGDKAVFMPGWKGWLYSVKKYNPTVDLMPVLVFAGDTLETVIKDDNVEINHIIANIFERDITKLQGVYCKVNYMMDGYKRSYVAALSKSDIDNIKGSAKTQSVWNKWYLEMAMTKAVRKACKVKFAEAVAHLEAYDNQESDLNQSQTINVTPKTELNLTDIKPLDIDTTPLDKPTTEIESQQVDLIDEINKTTQEAKKNNKHEVKEKIVFGITNGNTFYKSDKYNEDDEDTEDTEDYGFIDQD